MKWSFAFFLSLATSCCVHFFPLKPSLSQEAAQQDTHQHPEHKGNTSVVHHDLEIMLVVCDLWVCWIASLPCSVNSAPSLSGLGPPEYEYLDAAATCSATNSTLICTGGTHNSGKTENLLKIHGVDLLRKYNILTAELWVCSAQELIQAFWFSIVSFLWKFPTYPKPDAAAACQLFKKTKQ